MQLCCADVVVVAATPPLTAAVVINRYQQLVDRTSKRETESHRIASNFIIAISPAPPRSCTAYRLRLVSLTGYRICHSAPFRPSLRLALSFSTIRPQFVALLFSLPLGNHAGTYESCSALASPYHVRLIAVVCLLEA